MAQEPVGITGSQVCPRPTESEYVLEQDAWVTPALGEIGDAPGWTPGASISNGGVGRAEGPARAPGKIEAEGGAAEATLDRSRARTSTPNVQVRGKDVRKCPEAWGGGHRMGCRSGKQEEAAHRHSEMGVCL